MVGAIKMNPSATYGRKMNPFPLPHPLAKSIKMNHIPRELRHKMIHLNSSHQHIKHPTLRVFDIGASGDDRAWSRIDITYEGFSPPSFDTVESMQSFAVDWIFKKKHKFTTQVWGDNVGRFY